MNIATIHYSLHLAALARRRHRRRNRLADMIHRRIFRQRRLFDE